MQPNDHYVCDNGVSDEAIWRKHHDEIVRYATVLVGPAHAEDLLSAVVVRILGNQGSLTDLDEPRSYLFRSVLNESRNYRRGLRKPPLIRDQVEPRELRPEVLEAVGRLPRRQRAAVYLTYWKDLSVADAASLMGCRPGTVKRYLFLARQSLKEVLSDD
ncbi:MAG: RNA polymerase sigma factor [Acidimicrobiia bacterium]